MAVRNLPGDMVKPENTRSPHYLRDSRHILFHRVNQPRPSTPSWSRIALNGQPEQRLGLGEKSMVLSQHRWENVTPLLS